MRGEDDMATQAVGEARTGDDGYRPTGVVAFFCSASDGVLRAVAKRGQVPRLGARKVVGW